MSLVVKTTCLNCGKTIIGEAKEDELGMSIICPSCNSSSDVEDNAQEIHYFEIEFSNEPRNPDGAEGNCIGDYSICILGEREPSIREAAEFCKADMEKMGYKYVVNVIEIPKEEARTFFDIERENDFPIFK